VHHRCRRISEERFDYVGAAVGLILLLPFLLLIALLIKLDSPGPALYRRGVLGVGGQVFDAFKSRTILALSYVEAELTHFLIFLWPPIPSSLCLLLPLSLSSFLKDWGRGMGARVVASYLFLQGQQPLSLHQLS